jgi:hypothetical protein
MTRRVPFFPPCNALGPSLAVTLILDLAEFGAEPVAAVLDGSCFSAIKNLPTTLRLEVKKP